VPVALETARRSGKSGLVRSVTIHNSCKVAIFPRCRKPIAESLAA
jgi:hypothetical protein